MPKLGTIIRAQMRNGFLGKFGASWENDPTLAPQERYEGVVIGIWQVQENEFEPAHIDMLAVPSAIFQTFLSIMRGGDVTKAFSQLDAEAKAAQANKKAPPTAMRRIFLMEEGPIAFYDATLTMGEALEHMQDRNLAVQMAYLDSDDDDDDEEDGDEATTPDAAVAPAASGATAAAPVAAQPVLYAPAPYAQTGG